MSQASPGNEKRRVPSRRRLLVWSIWRLKALRASQLIIDSAHGLLPQGFQLPSLPSGSEKPHMGSTSWKEILSGNRNSLLSLERSSCVKCREDGSHPLRGFAACVSSSRCWEFVQKVGLGQTRCPAKFSLSKLLAAQSFIDQLLTVETFKVWKYYSICCTGRGFNVV